MAGGRLEGVPSKGARVWTLQSNAAPCEIAGECLSGHCADGVCCDAACSGARCFGCVVEATGVPTGTCAPLSEPQCDGYDCAPDGTCFTSCDDDSQCAALHTCTVQHECGPVGSYCDRNDRVDASGRAIESCAPYLCKRGVCTSTCGTNLDCAKGFTCDSEGHCVKREGESRASVGCQCSATGAPPTPARLEVSMWLWILGLAAAAARRAEAAIAGAGALGRGAPAAKSVSGSAAAVAVRQQAAIASCIALPPATSPHS